MVKTQQIADSPEEICPLLVGSTVPLITLSTTQGRPNDLRVAIEEKPTVLVYYRGGW